jgi:hypothetical protein
VSRHVSRTRRCDAFVSQSVLACHKASWLSCQISCPLPDVALYGATTGLRLNGFHAATIRRKYPDGWMEDRAHGSGG